MEFPAPSDNTIFQLPVNGNFVSTQASENSMNKEKMRRTVLEMDEMVKLQLQHHQMIIAMKGHPGSGKSTLARAIASVLRCPLIDKDDIRDCTAEAVDLQHQQEEEEEAGLMMMMNELSYEVIWRIAETQLQLGLSVVIDSPLSRRSHLDCLLQLVIAASSSRSRSVVRLVIIECKPLDEAEWRRRLEYRGRTIAATAAMVDVDDDDHHQHIDEDGDERRRTRRQAFSSHKPATWQDLQRLLKRYNGCWDYDMGDVPKLVLDTTAHNNNNNNNNTLGVGVGVGVGNNLVSSVLRFLSSVSSSWSPPST